MENKLESYHSRRNRIISTPKQSEKKCFKYIEVKNYDDNTGKVLTEVHLSEITPRENFRGYCVSDFALENIIASGATDMLKPAASLGVQNLDAQIDNLEQQLISITSDNN